MENVKECLDIEMAKEKFNDWLILSTEQFEKEKQLKNLQAAYDDLDYCIDLYNVLVKSEGKNSEIVKKFLEKNANIDEVIELVNEIKSVENKIKEILYMPICKEYSQFILLNDPNDEKRKLLVDIKTLDKIDVTGEQPLFLGFVIKSLKTQGCYIDIENKVKEHNKNCLPALMAIKEDLELNKNYKNDDSKSYIPDDEYLYWGDEGLAHEIGIEYAKAMLVDSYYDKKMDNLRNGIMSSMDMDISIKLPFVFDNDVILKSWKELDSKQKTISHEEYLLEYYKLVLLFGNSVEQTYLEAKDDEKQYVIDAYYYYSSEVLNVPAINNDVKKLHFRTTSPIINQEVLKRKIMQKTKVD